MHAFVSYVRENDAQVRRLCDALQESGISVWFDKDKLKPGERWKTVIREAIRNGSYFLCCFSTEYVTRHSSYANEELLLAIEELRKSAFDRVWFIPIRLSECDIPNRDIGGGETLGDLHRIDLFPDWNAGITKIVATIQPFVPKRGEEITIHLGTLKHQIIRLLQKHLVYTRSRHSPVFVSLLHLIDALRASLDQTGTAKLVETQDIRRTEEAYAAVGALESIAEAARIFAVFARVPSVVSRILNPPDTSTGLPRRVQDLSALLSTVRVNRSASSSDVERINDLVITILGDLYGEHSSLPRILAGFSVSLAPTLLDALHAANGYLALYGFPHVWDEVISQLPREVSQVSVLMDPFALFEVLKNILSNVRHSLSRNLPSSPFGSANVSLSIANDNPDESTPPPAPMVCLTFANSGYIAETRHSSTTFVAQAQEVADYGGRLEMHQANSTVIVTLRLLRRNEIPSLLVIEENRNFYAT